MSENLSHEDLLLRCLQGNADDQEYETSFKWINSSKSNFNRFKELRDAWFAAGLVTRRNKNNSMRAWSRVARRTGITWINIPNIGQGFGRIAALFIIAFTFGAFGYHLYFSQKEIFTEKEVLVQAPLGAKTFLVLPDNSTVWLNAGSSLKYSTHYEITDRSVHLSGEAYFDVKTNNKLPFRVYAQDIVINALGTQFNVKAYPEEKHVETTLISGLVSLEREVRGGDVEKILLRPNQRAYLSYGNVEITKIEMADAHPEYEDHDEIEIQPESPMKKISITSIKNPEVYTSWKDKRFVFERERMADLAVKLERIYDVTISFQDEALKNYHISGSLEQETLEQLLSAIRLTIPLDFSIKQNKVVLTLNHRLKDKYDKLSD